MLIFLGKSLKTGTIFSQNDPYKWVGVLRRQLHTPAKTKVIITAISNKNLVTSFASISKTILATSDSFTLIMSHILNVLVQEGGVGVITGLLSMM